MTKISGLTKIKKNLRAHDPGKKYDEILHRQEALNEQIKENGEESYQQYFVQEPDKKGVGFWFLVFLIVVSIVALINSLPIDWAAFVFNEFSE